MFHIQNIIMSQCNKRRSNNERAAIQRWSVIALQETWNFSENNEKKRSERNIKEINWSDLLRNCKHVDDATRFNSVALQVWKQRHCTSCNEFKSSSSFKKVSNMNEENCKLSACNALKLHNTDIWCIHYTEYKQSEDNH